MENMVKFGPKEMKGTIWDEGGKTNILQFLISHETDAINSIQFVYSVDKGVLRSEVHGKPNGLKLDIVTFNPTEYLVSLSGQYTCDQLASITFRTTNHTYGPFGSADDPDYDKFAYNFKRKSWFGGFHGCVYNSCVYAIGVYVKPLGSLAEAESDYEDDD